MAPALSSPFLHSNMRLSVSTSPFQQLLWSASLLLAWQTAWDVLIQKPVEIDNTMFSVLFLFFLFFTLVTWHTWLLCKDMKSLLSRQLIKLVLDALSYRLDLPLHFVQHQITWNSIQHDGLRNVRSSLTRSSPYQQPWEDTVPKWKTKQQTKQ